MIRFIDNNFSEETRHFHSQLEEASACNAFNPSMIHHDSRLFLTFRAPDLEGHGGKIFSYLSITDGVSKHSSLARLDRMLNTDETVADAKLFKIRNEIWITFNSGYDILKNRLYIARIFPNPSPPLSCSFGNRRPVEKNWAFFEYDGHLACLYSLRPLVILIAKMPSSSSIQELDFKEYYRGTDRSCSSLSIGTQLLDCGGCYYFIAHRKLRIFRKRIYFGLAARLRVDSEGAFKLQIENDFLFHDAVALMGSRKKWNPNLWACTYFSGLMLSALDPSKIILGYGINDNRCGFQSIERSDLWIS